MRAFVLLDTSADVDTPEMKAGNQAMLDAWAAAGPVDELANAVATIIINDAAENARWIARALPTYSFL